MIRLARRNCDSLDLSPWRPSIAFLDLSSSYLASAGIGSVH